MLQLALTRRQETGQSSSQCRDQCNQCAVLLAQLKMQSGMARKQHLPEVKVAASSSIELANLAHSSKCFCLHRGAGLEFMVLEYHDSAAFQIASDASAL